MQETRGEADVLHEAGGVKACVIRYRPFADRLIVGHAANARVTNNRCEWTSVRPVLAVKSHSGRGGTGCPSILPML